MKSFKDHDFEGYPEVQPKVLDYLGRNAAPKQSIEDLKAQMTEVLTSLSTVSTLAKQAKATANKAISAAGNGGRRRQGTLQPQAGQARHPPANGEQT
jgi:hypothetical protein